MRAHEFPVTRVDVSAYTIPTDAREGDGTFAWDKTTLVVAEVTAGNQTGIGYTYADEATALVIRETLANEIVGSDALDIPGSWMTMNHAIRNLGRPGIDSMAISAVDIALWDLKARLLGLPLASLLGQARDGAPVYGSGGFTTYSREQLQTQLSSWAAMGIPRVKIKVGSHPEDDVERVRQAREAIGPGVELFVDANGAYTRKQALKFAEEYAALGVVWFEEPRPSDDLEGLRLLRDRGPAGMDIAAGEYGYSLSYFQRMLAAGAVDVLQADASRCAGITGFLGAAALCHANHAPISAHCAPSLHVAPGCAVVGFVHLEYFHDHARIEGMLFDGVLTPKGGVLYPDLSRPGMGMEFKRADAERYRI
ncbi:mandelate racemase [Capsulimonas corticalis]|uniref:Mandelate racemase n=2 Tax=Capsulimonas corticalis TaxID=2219043 RepID=A0A9N7QGC7_9BACT|nr:mandelate racemase [Capsulimonas corticalis]